MEALIEDSGAFALPLTTLAELMNEVDDRVRRRADATAALYRVSVDGTVHYALAATRAAVATALVAAIERWHAAEPLSPGLDPEAARATLTPQPSARLFRRMLDELAQNGVLVFQEGVLRRPSHGVEMIGPTRVSADRVSEALRAVPLAPPTVTQLGEALGMARAPLLLLLKAMERHHQVLAITSDLYFDAGVVGALRDELARDPEPALSPASFRDRYKTSRRYAIPLLEYFDRTGLTVRHGDARTLKQPVKEA